MTQPIFRTTRTRDGKRLHIYADTQEHADAEADLMLGVLGQPNARERIIIITSPDLPEPIVVKPEMMDGEEHNLGNGVTLRFEEIVRLS